MFVKSNSYYSSAANASFCACFRPKPFGKTPARGFILRDTAACLCMFCNAGKPVKTREPAARRLRNAANLRVSKGNMSCHGTFF